MSALLIFFVEVMISVLFSLASITAAHDRSLKLRFSSFVRGYFFIFIRHVLICSGCIAFWQSEPVKNQKQDSLRLYEMTTF